MAVIDTSIELPRNCAECPYHQGVEDRIVCLKTENYVNVAIGCKECMIYCPLKSIDGLAEAIEQFPFTYGYASDIERVINKYCNKEYKDGKN